MQDNLNESAKRPRKRRRKKVLQPGEPIPARSAYNFFFKAEQERARSQQGGTAHNIAEIGAAWRSLDPATKAHYEHLAANDKQRYAMELIRWKQDQEQKQNASEHDRKPSSSPETSFDSRLAEANSQVSRQPNWGLRPEDGESTHSHPPINLPKRNDFHVVQHVRPLISTMDQQEATTTATTGSQTMPIQYQSDFSLHGSLPFSQYQVPQASHPLHGIDYTLPDVGQQRLVQHEAAPTLPQANGPGSFAWLADQLGEEGVDLFISLFK